MDFIKTSSLRALIELTFQRNWNGLIWMSRKGVITKRVKTVQTALSRISANRAAAGRETNVPRRPNLSVRLKSRPKFNHRPIRITTREAMSRGRPPRHSHATMPRTTMPREPGTSLAAAQPSRVPRPMHPSEPGRRPTSGRESIGQCFTRPIDDRILCGCDMK
ncbi:unnamed protein product [Microthlaspi erraticum]|uniref:Uncharacterized protein n=1 Tax=Microthlaspi erraticum TaxID=1685480 RepID=A0A6D2IN95_9BRAS|nr:unnamed protein product [Microthlaspi erraticum]